MFFLILALLLAVRPSCALTYGPVAFESLPTSDGAVHAELDRLRVELNELKRQVRTQACEETPEPAGEEREAAAAEEAVAEAAATGEAAAAEKAEAEAAKAEEAAASSLLPICTCEEASKSPLAYEYALRAGICASGTREIGPDPVTTACQWAVHSEYNDAAGKFNGAEPEYFNATDAHRFRVFDSVRWARIAPGEVTPQWECSARNGCADCDPAAPSAAARAQCTAERGFAYIWVPRGANASTPRILYVHGGSWLTGSPQSASYAPFCATIANATGMPVLAIDYTLAPLANHSAILAQASAGGLDGAAGAALGGAVLFSPWLNLPCDTPSYVSQIFKAETVKTAEEHRLEHCRIPGLSAQQARVAISGDVAFAGYPHSLSHAFALNGQTYAGSAEMMHDPVASPMRAGEALLARLPPIQIHVGLSEVLMAENAIFATKMAAAGAAYYEGCEHPKVSRLLFARSSLILTAAFLRELSTRDDGAPLWRQNGAPYSLIHYEYPRGVDAAMLHYGRYGYGQAWVEPAEGALLL